MLNSTEVLDALTHLFVLRGVPAFIRIMSLSKAIERGSKFTVPPPGVRHPGKSFQPVRAGSEFKAQDNLCSNLRKSSDKIRHSGIGATFFDAESKASIFCL